MNWKLGQLGVSVPGQEAGKLVQVREWTELCWADCILSTQHFPCTTICSQCFRRWLRPAGPGICAWSIKMRWEQAIEKKRKRCLQNEDEISPFMPVVLSLWENPTACLLLDAENLNLSRSNQKDGSSVHHPFSCLYAHGGDQGWRQQSVLSYVLQLLFVEKAGGVHTMVKVMLNVPFRNNSSMWTDIAPERNKATCRVSWDKNAV